MTTAALTALARTLDGVQSAVQNRHRGGAATVIVTFLSLLGLLAALIGVLRNSDNLSNDAAMAGQGGLKGSGDSDLWDNMDAPGRRANNNNYPNSKASKLFEHTGDYEVIANPHVVQDLSGKEDERPPLQALVDEQRSEVIGDVQFLLDFAIVGHSKTGTTAQMNWLADRDDEIRMYHHEIHSLKNGKPAELVSLLYALPAGGAAAGQYKYGYKSPNDILSGEAMGSIRQYWPATKLIVGVRHPVKWFESYYNFNARQGHELPPAETMVGDKLSPKMKYHEHLARLGKTALAGESEWDLLGDLKRTLGGSRPTEMPNQVFVYEVSQPFDHNRSRAETYSADLSNFLGMSEPLEPIVPRESSKASRNYHYAIDICDSKFDALRGELMEVSRNASKWLSEYFLDLPDVTVSQRDRFENELLASWQSDPCDEQ